MKFGRQLSSNIIWRGLYLVTNFIINILLAQLFAAKDNGTINMFINNGALLILITGFSLETGLNYFGAAKIIPHKVLLKISLTWSFIAGMISMGLILLIDTRFGLFFPHVYQYGLLAFAYLTGYFLINNVSAMFYAGQQFKSANVILLSGNIGFLLFLWIVFLFPGSIGKLPVLTIYLLLFFVQGLSLAVIYYRQLPAETTPFVFRATHFTALVKFISFAALINLTFFLVNRIDYWFVEKYCTPKELGNYIQASRLGQAFLILPGIAATIIFSRVAAKDSEPISRALPVLGRILLLLNSVVVLLIAITGYWLLPWLYGETFELMYVCFLLLAPGVLALSMSRLTSAYFGGSSALAINFKGNMIALVLIVAGDLLLIPAFGLQSAAVVSSLGYIAFAGYSLAQFCRLTKTPFAAFLVMHKKDLRHIRHLFQITKPGNEPV